MPCATGALYRRCTVLCHAVLCRIGVVGDLGETANSTQTVAGLVDARPDVLINVGDYCCECGANQSHPIKMQVLAMPGGV